MDEKIGNLIAESKALIATVADGEILRTFHRFFWSVNSHLANKFAHNSKGLNNRSCRFLN